MIEKLNNTVWATIGKSKIHGVGVIAIRDIPKGTMITDYSVHNITAMEMMKVSADEFHLIDPAIQKLILDRTMFHRDQKTFYFYSPNCEQTLRSFMNHSARPNSDGVYALKDIKKGQEITENYLTMSEPHPLVRDNMKEIYEKNNS